MQVLEKIVEKLRKESDKHPISVSIGTVKDLADIIEEAIKEEKERLAAMVD